MIEWLLLRDGYHAGDCHAADYYHAGDCHPPLDDYQLSCLGMVIVIMLRDEYHAWGLSCW